MMRYFFLSLFCLFFLLIPKTVLAANSQFITVVNPVRGADFFTLKGVSPAANVEKEWAAINVNHLNATWLLRPDALQDSQILNVVKNFSANQELGLFLEVTPSWTGMAGVNYHAGSNWHDAGSVFLTGYEVADRHKLIDSAFEKFKTTFGYYPKSVGAWWIDAGSLSYMKDKYSITANMDVADQYTTDNYQVWGQFFSTPFYPSQRNALVPASGPDRKIGVVTIQWASRDPYNSYGNGVLDSTYSVQANDYANPKFHSLNTDYFNKLLSIYLDNPNSNFGQVTVGLENDFDWNQFGAEYQRQLQVVFNRQRAGTQVMTMSQFATAYQQIAGVITPYQVILADDPLGSGMKVLWYQNLAYRVGWFQTDRGSLIKDLRLYRDSLDEPCLEKSCQKLDLAMIETHNIDEVTYGNSWIIDEGKIADVKVALIPSGVRLTYVNQLGNVRTVDFLPNDIRVDNIPKPIPVVINESFDQTKNLPKITGNYSYKLKVGLVKTLEDQAKNLAIFLIAAILLFFLPGWVLLRNWKVTAGEKLTLSVVVGLSFFTLVSYLLIYLKIWWLIFILPVGSLPFVITHWPHHFFVLSLDRLKKMISDCARNSLTIFIILAGSASWLATMVKNGLVYDFGLGFWGAHGHDALWHLSLIESLKKGSLENPIFAGEQLHNYHYFYDLLLAETARITGLSSLDLYFRYFPLLVTVACGVTTYQLAKAWFKSAMAGNLAVFFLYFGGSFGWLVSYFRDRSLGGETLFWAQQGISTFINPPFAISILIFLAGLILFLKLTAEKQWILPMIVPLVILWGSLIEFKAYAGILVLGALGVVTLFELIQKRFGILKLSLPVAALSLIVFLPNNLGSGSLLVFSPFWLVNSMVDFPDRLSWYRLSLTRQAGFETGNWFKIIGSEALGLVIFVVGNLGTRILGFFNRKSWSSGIFDIFAASFLVFSLAIPLLFIQTGANFNIVQFFYYFLLIFNFLAAAALTKIALSYRKVGWIVVVGILVLTLPTTWDTLHQFLPSRPPAMVSSLELEALNYLKQQPDGVVLNYFYDKKLKEQYDPPVPLFAYESTAYVGALSNKAEFVADTVNLDILGLDYSGRLQAQKDILALKEPSMVNKLLKENNISYVYAPKALKFNVSNQEIALKKIFENDEVRVYKVE